MKILFSNLEEFVLFETPGLCVSGFLKQLLRIFSETNSTRGETNALQSTCTSKLHAICGRADDLRLLANLPSPNRPLALRVMEILRFYDSRMVPDTSSSTPLFLTKAKRRDQHRAVGNTRARTRLVARAFRSLERTRPRSAACSMSTSDGSGGGSVSSAGNEGRGVWGLWDGGGAPRGGGDARAAGRSGALSAATEMRALLRRRGVPVCSGARNEINNNTNNIICICIHT